MTDKPTGCPGCDNPLSEGFLYVRGFGTALLWSEQGDTGLMSRKNLQQIDLDKISTTNAGVQAVIKAWRCPSCEFVGFQST